MSALTDLLDRRSVDELVPGDPGVAEVFGQRLKPYAGRWEESAEAVLAVDPTWVGSAGDAYRNRRALDANGWWAAAQVLADARTAILHYADALSGAKADAVDAQIQFEHGMQMAADQAAADHETLPPSGSPFPLFPDLSRIVLAQHPAGREVRDAAVAKLAAAQFAVEVSANAAAAQLRTTLELPWSGTGLGYYPPQGTDGDPTGMGGYDDLVGPVPLGDDDFSLDNLHQGQIGDCWFLSGAGSVGAVDPDLIRQHIQHNADGTYTVTLYQEQDGDLVPVQVTVNGSVLENGGDRGADGQPSWLSIYEKAAAQLRGGDYDDISGGDPAKALEMVTGQRADKHEDPSLESIREGLADGRAYAVSTENHHTKWPFDDEVDDDRVVPNHAYVIDQVREVDGHLEVHVVNPWGPGGGYMEGDSHEKDGALWLTEQQFHDSFDDVSSVKVK